MGACKSFGNRDFHFRIYSPALPVSMCRRLLLGHYNSLKVRIFRRRLTLWRDSPKRPSGAKAVSARRWSRIAGVILVTAGLASPAAAQSLPSEPIVFGDGH